MRYLPLYLRKMTTPLQQLRKIRLDKLAKIREHDINPYPAGCRRDQTITKARQMMAKKVSIAGRIMAIRGHGGIHFFDLIDESGEIQLVFKIDDQSQHHLQLLKLLDIGDFIDVQGEIFTTKAGEISVLVKSFHLLTKSIRPLPDKWYGLKDVEERYRERYIDLIVNSKIRDIFYLRSKVLTSIRKFLDDHGFLEVETPILQPMYGGAAARPFVTYHNALNCNLYLRISDELYLKRLIVGGFEKVYEIGKDFRNEGLSRQHNPEFTMVEFYWAYANYEDLMTLTEELINLVLKKTLGKTKLKYEETVLDFSSPIRRLNFRDFLLQETGIDADKVKTEDELLAAIRKRKIDIDLKGVFGCGEIFDKLYKERMRPKVIQPTFLLDYPASMITLAKRKEKSPDKIASFQLLVNGFELVKAYNELNDPQDQKKRWLEAEKLVIRGAKEAERLDDAYIRALEYGMPPTAGWGMGLDRLLTLLTGVHTLKEVILFPTLRPQKEKK